MSAAPEDRVLTVTGLRVRRGRAPVVHDATLTVDRGEIVAVLGPNGAGKSTLLEAVGGVARAQGGTVEHVGRVATVLQSPGLATRSVRANVELALAWWGVPRSQRRGRAMEALEQMRAGHLARRHALTLSGGERRRVHVARGIALCPELLLLDEPFAGLDPETRAALCEDTSSALRTAAGGVVVVVHDRQEAWALATRLVVMIAGRIVATGRPDDLLAAPPSAEVARFLGYDGELLLDGERVLTRPAHVVVTPDGDLAGTVTRLVPQQDGVRIEVTTTQGVVRAVQPTGSVRLADQVRFGLAGAVRFAATDAVTSS